ncbi:MAG: SusD/RagB family nutrient-binding outer membrane lipoprotein [Bacteroidales bacterium]|nr:SusD/RagB family nutrient-binding outer membrane lipoprotein [Bacteroidales bacterium]
MKTKIFHTMAVALGMAAALGTTSCDSYLDINANPNSPTEDNLDASMVFPGAELAFVTQYGSRLRIFGGYYSQYYAQLPGTSNYLPLNAFTQTGGLSDITYVQLYERALCNLDVVRNLAEADDDMGSYLAATVMRVATFQVLVDCYGTVPYTEALDSSNPMPNYDEGEDIYPALVAELDDALSKAAAGDPVCTNFLFQGETATNWIRTANALKLRILMRMSNAVNVQSQLAALIAEDNFPKGDVYWQDCWANQAGNTNPFYYEEFYPGRQNNISLNVALENTYEDAQDAREAAVWNVNDEDDYQGWVSTAVGITSQSQYFNSTGYSRPNIVYNSPVYFITKAETEFFLAEYEQRYGSATAAKEHYENAVIASFETCGLSSDEAQLVLYAYPYSASDYMRVIGIQKWVHLAGTNPFEGYCELRRIGYPAFGSVQGDDIYNQSADNFQPMLLPAGTLYTPIQVSSDVGANQLLQRWPLPSSSTSTNTNAPTFLGATTPIFWAK